jgi:hypothetical protein
MVLRPHWCTDHRTDGPGAVDGIWLARGPNRQRLATGPQFRPTPLGDAGCHGRPMATLGALIDWLGAWVSAERQTDEVLHLRTPRERGRGVIGASLSETPMLVGTAIDGMSCTGSWCDTS